MTRLARLSRLAWLAILASALPAVAATTAVAQPAPDDRAPASDTAIRPAVPAWGAEPRNAAPTAAMALATQGVPGWFRIGVPTGWQLQADRASGRIEVSAADGRSVRLWLVLVPRAIGAAEAASLFAGAAAQFAPRARWPQPAAVANGTRITLSAQARDGDIAHAAGLSVLPADRVSIALFAMASAPNAYFERSRDLFAAVMESFVPLPGNAGGSAAGNVAYVRWSDPIEGAFALDVPKGWTVQGGTTRKSAVDVRQVVHLTNPEQSVLIQAGDAEIPPFTEPWGFLREGQYNGPSLVLRFQGGVEFARSYLGWRVQPAMRDVAIDVARPLPQLRDLLQSIYNASPAIGIDRRVDVGELLFHGIWNGRKAKGYLFAATTRVAQQGGGAMWFAGGLGSLLGFIAAEDQVATVAAIIERMRNSYEVNPQWFGANARIVDAVSRITTETNRYISDVITRSYASTQAAYASIFDRYSHYQRDVVDLTDPQSRTSYQVQAGSNYYWIDDRGDVVGTNAHFNPDPLWFREMLTLKP